jgi:hypothetical protein
MASKALPPTYSEIRLRSILRSKKIAFKDSQIIWYTGCDRYTQDFHDILLSTTFKLLRII